MITDRIARIESENRLQLPAEWTEALGLRGQVILEKTEDGILVRPCRPLTWEEIFATKLTMGSAPPDEKDNVVEMTGDDFIF